MYTCILFDLDGTLTDSAEGIINSVIYSLNELKAEIPDTDTLRKFIGPPLAFSYPEYCGFDEAKTKEAIRIYRERYSSVGKFENTPYPGIKEVLEMLKAAGYKLAIASSKPTEFVEDILAHFDIKAPFDAISGATFDGKRGTKEEVIEYAFELLGIDEAHRRECVMVGDRHYDIKGAIAFGLDSVGVKYGFAEDGELEEAGATYVVDTVEELGKLLMEKLAQ